MQYEQNKCLAQMIEPLVAMPAACGPRGMAPLRKRFTNEQDLAQAIEPFVVAASYLPAVKSITSKYVAQQKFLVQELYKLHANLAFKQSMFVKIHAKIFDDHRTHGSSPPPIGMHGPRQWHCDSAAFAGSSLRP